MEESLQDFTAPEFDLSKKVVVITGAAGGLGSAMALSFADKGASVVVSDLDDSAIDGLVAGIERRGGTACGAACNVTRQREVENLVETAVSVYGRLDVMVNNAGIDRPAKAIRLTEENLDLVMNINFKGTFFGCTAAAKQMLAQGDGGRIINIGSAGAFLGTKNMSAYCASKAAVVNLTKTLAMEWGTEGITVNAVCPGVTPTNVNAAARANPKIEAAMIERTALKRLGTPKEVAAMVLFLASDASSMITGAALPVDMGATCN